MDASINQDILRSCNELSDILHNLELHIAPADLTGKRLLAVARDRLMAIVSAVERDLSGGCRPELQHSQTVLARGVLVDWCAS
jgi:hypothetical protein